MSPKPDTPDGGRTKDRRLLELGREEAAAYKARSKVSARIDKLEGGRRGGAARAAGAVIHFPSRKEEIRLNKAEEAQRLRWREACQAIARTPAESMTGIAVKLRVIRRDFDWGKAEFSDAILRSAARDAERLAR